MGGLVKVTVIGPVKIGTTWFRAGDGAEVTPAEKAELARAGVIVPDTAELPEEPTPEARLYTADEWDAAVAEAARALAEATVPAIVEKAVEDLTAERDGAIERAQEAEAERDRLRVINADLETRLAAAQAQGADESGASGRAETDAPAAAQKASPKGRAAKG